MLAARELGEAYWTAARVIAQRLDFALAMLAAGGFEVFAPRVETRTSVEPLFSGYAFVRVNGAWRAVERTPGVMSVVRFGDAPARCPDREIERLRARVAVAAHLVQPIE